MNNVKYWREKNRMTQHELAEKSGISLRTIQRIEAGSSLKGYTLKAIADTFNTTPESLCTSTDETDVERSKRINLSALLGLVIPFGGILFPLFLTAKTADLPNKQLGKKITEIQIILTIILSITLIGIPFIQKEYQITKPVFIYVLILILILKVVIVIVNGICLNTKKKLAIQLKSSFL